MADAPPARTTDAGFGPWLSRLRRAAPSLSGLFGLLVALAVLFALFIPGFASPGTVQAIMFQMPELGLLSLAMLIPLISGGLNLAIIATANQSALLMAYTMAALVPAGAGGGTVAFGVAAALVLGLLLCAAWGAATGALVAYTGVHPILVTLGTKSLIDGISVYLTQGTVLSGLPPAYAAAGNAVVLGVPVPFLVLAAAAGLVGLVLRRTPFGVSVAMIGSNLEATRYSAVDTRRVLVGVYLASGLLCFVASCLMLARFNSASAGYAQSYLLITILAAVLGGVDPYGGFGRVSGLILALAVLQFIASGANLLGFSDYLTLAIWGLTLILVVAAPPLRDALLRRRGRAPASRASAS